MQFSLPGKKWIHSLNETETIKDVLICPIKINFKKFSFGVFKKESLQQLLLISKNMNESGWIFYVFLRFRFFVFFLFESQLDTVIFTSLFLSFKFVSLQISLKKLFANINCLRICYICPRESVLTFGDFWESNFWHFLHSKLSFHFFHFTEWIEYQFFVLYHLVLRHMLFKVPLFSQNESSIFVIVFKIYLGIGCVR